MYIRELKIQHLKRLKDFELKFPELIRGKYRKHRMPWMVLIGENGTCKTAILQAIAMTAAGGRQVNNLADRVVGHLVDRREKEPMWVEATFNLPEGSRKHDDLLPGLRALNVPLDQVRIASTLSLESGSDTIYGASWYEDDQHGRLDTDGDPLDLVRSQRLPWWFVAAYGVARILPDSAFRPVKLSPTDRLKPLFDQTMQLTSTSFANYFDEDKDRSRSFARALQAVLTPAKGDVLLPEVIALSLSGRGGVTRASDLLDRHRFRQQLGQHDVGIPAVALAHGYQSTIAWIADLIGHILLEAREEVRPQDMAGLVLVDEIDLYIHPTLQVSLIRSLKTTFPLIQFVVSTHSPLVLAAMRTDEDEIVRLVVDKETGDVVRKDMKEGAENEPDARIMTTASIYETWFGLPDVFGGPEGMMLVDYQSIASNPYRSDAADKRMLELSMQLQAVGVDPVYAPVSRQKRRSEGA